MAFGLVEIIPISNLIQMDHHQQSVLKKVTIQVLLDITVQDS